MLRLLAFFRRHWKSAVFFIILAGMLASGKKAQRPLSAAFPKSLVLSVAVRRGSVEQTVDLTGRVEPKHKAEIKSLQGGVIKKMHVIEGQDVKKGDLLAEIQQEPNYAWQSATVEGRMISAKAVYEDAKTRLERYERLFERGVISADKVSEARRELGKAEASLREARLQARTSAMSTGHGSTLHTRLVSPMSGKVVKVRYHEGEIIISGSNFAVTSESESATVLEVADMSDMIVRLQVPETDIAFLRHGQGARVSVQATHAVFPASVYAISPAGDTDPKTNTVRYEVLGDVFGEGEKLLPGMTTDVTIPVESRKDVLWLPPEYVYEDDKGAYVLVGEDMKKKRIKTGLRTMDAVEILSGLSYGDKVSRIRILDPNEFDIVKL